MFLVFPLLHTSTSPPYPHYFPVCSCTGVFASLVICLVCAAPELVDISGDLATQPSISLLCSLWFFELPNKSTKARLFTLFLCLFPLNKSSRGLWVQLRWKSCVVWNIGKIGNVFCWMNWNDNLENPKLKFFDTELNFKEWTLLAYKLFCKQTDVVLIFFELNDVIAYWNTFFWSNRDKVKPDKLRHPLVPNMSC